MVIMDEDGRGKSQCDNHQDKSTPKLPFPGDYKDDDEDIGRDEVNEKSLKLLPDRKF